MRYAALTLALATGWLAGLAPAAEVRAGPWPRAAGERFVSASLGAEGVAGARRGVGQLYAEFGLSPGRMSGRVAGGKLRLQPGARSGDLFLRWHPAAGPAPPWALGLEAGLHVAADARRRGGDRAPAGYLRGALHLGRDLALPAGAGWARLSLSVEAPLTRGLPAQHEAVAQLGLRGAGGWLGLVGLSAHERDGTVTLKLMPAVGRQLAPRRDLLLEAALEPGRGGSRGLTLSLWQGF